MNLNKYTKAELISKIKGLKQNNESKDSILSNIMTTLLLFKSFLLKITLIALIVKIFKKYSIFRKIFTVINTILFSIFGISMIDIYEIEILSKFFNNLIDIFSKFHSNILELFGKKIDVPVKAPSNSMRGIQPETTGIQTNNESSNRIIERFSKIIHNEEEIQPDIIEESTPFYKNRDTYLKLAGILVLLGLGYYYWEDISPIASSIFARIYEFRSRPNTNPDDSNGNLPGHTKSNLQSLKDWLSNKFSKKPKDDGSNSPGNSLIGLFDNLDKGKAVDLSNLTQSEIERRARLPETMKGLQHITGDTDKFDTEADAILKEINSFNIRQETKTFPHEQIQEGLYTLLRERLHKLASANPEQYQRLIKSDYLNDLLNKFVDLESSVFRKIDDSPKSTSYNEVELSTIQEQDVWSDKANTPEQMLSPHIFAQTAIDSIEKPEVVKDIINKDNMQEPITPLETLKNYWDGFKKSNTDEGIAGPFTLTMDDIIPEENLIGPEILPEAKPLIKEVLNNSDNSNDSLDHFFPEVVKPNIEINNPTGEAPTVKLESEQEDPRKNPSFINLFSKIKSTRKEYGTPNISSVGLPRPDLSPLNIPSNSNLPENVEDTNNEDSNESIEDQKEEYLPLHNWKEEIKLNIHRGSVENRVVDFDLGEHAKDIKSLYFITNDGVSFSLNPNISYNMAHTNSIKWDIKGKSNLYWKDLDLYSINLIDKNGTLTQIYSNKNVKFLPNFGDNIGKKFT
jgi:hypothetical protein